MIEFDIQKHFSYYANMQKVLADLLHKIIISQKNHRQKLRETGAALSPFNYYGIMRLDEKGACVILADLLSPAGSHYQGTFFLNQFLCKAGIVNNFASLENGVAITEKYTNEDNSKRYLDIFIDCDELKICIECKFYAEDQCLQLASYLDWLRHISGKNAYYLIYLTPDGHDPAEGTLPSEKRKEHEDHLLTMAWPDLLNCLEAATAAPELPAKIRYFVHDYCSAIRKYKFGEGIMAQTEHKEIVQAIEKETSDSEFLAAFSMRYCYGDVIKNIHAQWVNNLAAALKNAGCNPDNIQECDFLNYHNPDCAYAIKVQYPDYVTVGIYRETENTPIYLAIWARTCEYYPKGLNDDNIDLICALKKKYDVATLKANNIKVDHVDMAKSDDPEFLLKIRRTDPVYLAKELIGLCKTVENTARELGIEL